MLPQERGFSVTQTFKHFIEQFLYNPIVLVFLRPLSYLMIGTVYALQYNTFNRSVFFLLYLYLFTNYYIESYLSKHELFAKSTLTLPFILLEVINLVLIITLAVSTNYLVALLTILYSLIMHFQHYLKRIGWSNLTILVVSFFKGGIITYLSFFTQVHFLPLELLKWSIPLVLVSILVEMHTYYLQTNVQQPILKKDLLLKTLFLITLIYLTTIILLASTFGYLLVLFLFTVPFILHLINMMHRKKEKKLCLKTLFLYQMTYLFVFTLIETISFYLL